MSDARSTDPHHAQAILWLEWWTRTYWQRAEPGWRGAAFYGYDAVIQARLGQYHALEIAQACGITPELPGPPDERVLGLMALTAQERTVALALAAETCVPQGAGAALSPARKIWCRRLAKALRTEYWLPDEPVVATRTAGLFLLRAAVPDSWRRLRLAFPPDEIGLAERLAMRPLPVARLHTLWDAVIWQSRQQEGKNNVEH